MIEIDHMLQNMSERLIIKNYHTLNTEVSYTVR